MRLALIGQQAFGAAALEAFLARGDEVAGVFCAPEKPGARPDPLRTAAEQRGLKVFQFPSLKDAEAEEALRALDVDIGVMAYVLQFAPQSFVNIPRHGSIQYHPSLLPLYRGPSSINWPIIKGDTVTGLTIFRPTDGLDEGPVILQNTVAISADDTLGSVYFDRLFPQGRDAEAQINWRNHVDHVYNLIRGCNPSPGAWTTVQGRKLQVFDAAKRPARRFADVAGKPGDIAAIGEESVEITLQGGRIELFKVRAEGGPKTTAAEFARAAGLKVGDSLVAAPAKPALAPQPTKALEPAGA